MRNTQQRNQAVMKFIEEHPVKYSRIRKFATDNWNVLVATANGPHAVSIADQIQVFTECPYPVAEDVAQYEAWAHHK